MEGRICGIDFSGVVLEAARGSPFKPGDLVYGTVPPFTGSMAEIVVTPSDFIAIKPKTLSHAKAAAVPLVGLSILEMFDDLRLTSDDHVLVIGASGGTGHVGEYVDGHMYKYV